MSSPITAVVSFQFQSSTIRTVTLDGEHWFVAKDVCDVLDIANSRDAITSLDEDEKGVAITDTLGGKQSLTTVSESGLYALIFKSRKPEAKAFRKWVTGEVLPALRKTGRYAASSSPSSPPSLPAAPLVGDERPGPEWFSMKEIAAAWNMPRRNAALRVDKLVAQGRAVKYRTPGNPWRPWYYRFTDGAASAPVPAAGSPVPATAEPEAGYAAATAERRPGGELARRFAERVHERWGRDGAPGRARFLVARDHKDEWDVRILNDCEFITPLDRLADRLVEPDMWLGLGREEASRLQIEVAFAALLRAFVGAGSSDALAAARRIARQRAAWAEAGQALAASRAH